MKKVEISKIKNTDFAKDSEEIVQKVLSKWIEFENTIIEEPWNNKYFYSVTYPETQTSQLILNYDGYYKGSTINEDIKDFEFD